MPAPVAVLAALSDISPLMRNRKHLGEAGDCAAMPISPQEIISGNRHSGMVR
jgi:hypothetical protein